MPNKEKAHQSGGPISKIVLCTDNAESIALQLHLQVSMLVRRVGVDAGIATTLAPMVFGVLT
jgi:hypothetical protein